MSISRILSHLAVDAPDDAIPQASYDAAVKMLLDTCACAFAGRKAPGIAELIQLETELSAQGNGSIYFSDTQLTLPAAVFCNAAMIHAMDFDNNYPGADIHILAIVVPIALACSEEKHVDGQRCLSSMIRGVEVTSRLAKPYIRARRAHSYFLTTSLVGGWGGVATAAYLLGLSVEQTIHAMGIYYAHTCGNRQALLERALSKRIQPAIAARAALYSVLLAQRGLTGPEYCFEGAGGFYACYTQDPPPEEVVFRSDSFDAIGELVVKKFPTCGIHHANVISALHLKQEIGFTGSDIAKVEFYLREGGKTLVSMPFTPGPTPQVDAQFCAPYAIALALNKGRVSIHDFRPEQILADQETIDLAQRTTEVIHIEDLALKNYPQPVPGCHYLKVFLRNGTILEHECRGGVPNDRTLMKLPDVLEKFHTCACMYDDVEPAIINEWIEALMAIQTTKDSRKFIQTVLVRPGMRKPNISTAEVTHRLLVPMGTRD